MAYIIPNSTIYLYNNILLDNSYKDTLYFNTRAEQNEYFDVTHPYKFAFLMQMYQRTNKGTLRIEKNAEALYDCNYLRFKNPRVVGGTTFDKWYYAFITNWEYINENVTEITYEIDIMQTYFFDVVIEPSFVVRQHSETDEIGDNVLVESINPGPDYVVANDSEVSGSNPANAKVFPLDNIVLLSNGFDVRIGAFDASYMANKVNNTLFTGIYHVEPFTQAGLTNAKDWIVRMAGGVEGIIANFAVPHQLASLVNGAEDYYVDALNIGGVPQLFGNYRPHNYKLYTYPYSYISAENMQGQENIYKYELFNNPSSGNIVFNFRGVLLPVPTIIAFPAYYRKLTYDVNNSVTVGNFPNVSISESAFTEYWRQNQNKFMTGLTTMAITGIIQTLGAASGIPVDVTASMFGVEGSSKGTLGAHLAAQLGGKYDERGLGDVHATPNLQRNAVAKDIGVIGSLANTGSKIANAIAGLADVRKMPSSSSGAMIGDGILAATNNYRIMFLKMQVREEYARSVDTFFDLYGYAQNKIMAVNRNVRPVYTYVKTAGANVHQAPGGNTGANSAVISALSEIYDNGITFWKASSGVTIGDYSDSVRSQNSLHP